MNKTNAQIAAEVASRLLEPDSYPVEHSFARVADYVLKWLNNNTRTDLNK